MSDDTIDYTSKIIQTTTRSPSDNTWSWSHGGKLNNIYSEEEYTQYIEPYFILIENTLGFQSLEFFVDDNIRTYTITYDSPISARVAHSQLFGPNSVQIAKDYRNITKIKRDSLNVEYQSNTLIHYHPDAEPDWNVSVISENT